MKLKNLTKIAASVAACLTLSTEMCSAFDYAGTVDSFIQFNGDSTFTFTPNTNNFVITSGSGLGLIGELTGNFTIGTVTTFGPNSVAPVTGTGVMVIHDGGNNLTAALEWDNIFQSGTLGALNTVGTVNLTSITYSGSNPDLLALKVGGSGVNTFTFQFVPSVSLSTMVSSPVATSFSGSIIPTTPPPCDCRVSFNSPAFITNCVGDTIPGVTASQVCGSGQPLNVAVTYVGSVTNGDCPKIITRTYTAVDGCDKLQTFVQTLTLNCEPDCTLTASVTVTAPGTTGLTASVADLGAGANYLWTIDDGSITSGQGTSKITWTAGTDTSKSVTITVIESTAAGCISKCKIVIPFTPTGLGHGDTATIGFWHNKNGQGLILGASNSPALGNWLGTNYPCMFGSLAGKANSVVAAQFLTYFDVSGKKTQAQVMAGALAAYFTSSNLGGGSASAGFGFNVTPGGTGSKSYNVGSLGTALGLQNNTSYTVFQLLQAANSHCPFSSAVYDALNDIFNGINQKGDIK